MIGKRRRHALAMALLAPVCLPDWRDQVIHS
jgi:hypothetical protein